MSDNTANMKTYFQPAFLICVVVLAAAGGGMSYAIKSFGVYLEKEPIPLKKSLDLLDDNGMGAYKVLKKRKIENEDIIASLGTSDYIEWLLEDTDVEANSDVRKCFLFITYYDIIYYLVENRSILQHTAGGSMGRIQRHKWLIGAHIAQSFLHWDTFRILMSLR